MKIPGGAGQRVMDPATAAKLRDQAMRKHRELLARDQQLADPLCITFACQHRCSALKQQACCGDGVCDGPETVDLCPNDCAELLIIQKNEMPPKQMPPTQRPNRLHKDQFANREEMEVLQARARRAGKAIGCNICIFLLQDLWAKVLGIGEWSKFKNQVRLGDLTVREQCPLAPHLPSTI